MGNLERFLSEFVDAPTDKPRGRPVDCGGAKPGPKPRVSMGAAATPVLTPAERQKRRRRKVSEERTRRIAVLDMETDPFDAVSQARIEPFLAVLYSNDFDPIVIWENDNEKFCERVAEAIIGLPEQYTIYAHNGGRFDYLFLLHKMRGSVCFKGRGIMSARIGRHELRDSFHIIPERLANWQKDVFDYSKLKRSSRDVWKKEIITYCINDCRYLLDIILKFIEGFGLKLTIGQAAMSKLKEVYDVGKFDEGNDDYIRQWFYGGRVECLRGRGDFVGEYKLYDVNSLYPYVMSAYNHPIGNFGAYKIRYGAPSDHTVFIDLECRNNGALVGRNEAGETTARVAFGRFRTTIHEYEVACKHKLISDIKINFVIDCYQRSNFSNFVLPLYENRLTTKSELDRMKHEGKENTPAFMDMKKDDIFYKLLLNNAYGKFAINPRNFKENYLTDPDEQPPDEWFRSINMIREEHERTKYLLPVFESDRYWIWQKPNPGFRFNNVGVAASITGAARAVLLDGLQHAIEPIYCDTDSIICRDLPGLPISKTQLGAWDLEDEFTRVIVNGKKLYSVEHKIAKKRSAEQLNAGLDPGYTVKSKGASGITWDEMEALLGGAEIVKANKVPTIDRYGDQYYIERKIRATAQVHL